MKHFNAFLSLLFSLSLVFSACNTGGGQPSNKPTPTPSVTKFKITFDNSNTGCEKGAQGGEVFTSGSKIEEGVELKFTAKLIDGQTLENWYINDNKKENETKKDFVYKVVATDADNNKVINISYKSNALKLTFDPTQIKCKKGYGGSGAQVASGTKVKEGEDYQFTPLITEDEIVDAWYAGKRKITSSPLRDPKGYTVKKEDADDKNVIQIRLEKRAIKTATLKFDRSTVSCKKGYIGTGEEVSSDTTVKETEDYQFTAKLNAGEKVKHWVINGKAQTSKTKTTFSYTVKKDDINTTTNSITISWEKE